MHKEVKSNSSLQTLVDNFDSEANSRALLERIRWPGGVRCPRDGCESDKIMRFKSRPIFKCKTCKRQFSVTVGTIFEDSHIPLRTWLHVIYLMCASKKGMSAHQIHRQFGVTYKSAWYMCHRVRWAMRDTWDTRLTGVIEADETYVGGKPRRHPSKKKGTMREAVSEAKRRKTPVLGMLERGGRVRAIPIKPISKKGVQVRLRQNIDLAKSRLVTDESFLYEGIEDHLPHDTIRHADAYIMGHGIHTQGIENFWSLLKRGLIGTYHHVTPHYLSQYVGEFSFRYNARKMTDPERFAHALKNVEGRLSWFSGQS